MFLKEFICSFCRADDNDRLPKKLDMHNLAYHIHRGAISNVQEIHENEKSLPHVDAHLL